jgi:X-X-X-Leu-X-X-Gly heptad repeat protein
MTGLLSKLTKGVQQAASGSPAAYSASNPPAYIYKVRLLKHPLSVVNLFRLQILPHHTVNPRYALPPVPIPASFEFPVSELDAKDGFLHFSTTLQVSRTPLPAL